MELRISRYTHTNRKVEEEEKMSCKSIELVFWILVFVNLAFLVGNRFPKKKYHQSGTCKECVFFRSIGHTCHFNPPKAGHGRQDKWPYVSDRDSCGRWRLSQKLRRGK